MDEIEKDWTQIEQIGGEETWYGETVEEYDESSAIKSPFPQISNTL